MHIGSQYYTETGALQWISSERYYFLNHDPDNQVISFVLFTNTTQKRRQPRATLFTANTGDFSYELQSGNIKPCSTQFDFPPWLEEYRGVNVEILETQRRSSVNSYASMIDRRLETIKTLIDNAEAITTSPNPQKTMSRLMQQQNDKNITRAKFWFYSYVLFGRNRYALMPRFNKTGKYDRSSIAMMTKLGRKAISNEIPPGHSVHSWIIDAILEGYAKHAGPGINRIDIYILSVKSEFGCTSVLIDGEPRMIQPQGLPFPSFRQFMYRVFLKYTKAELQRHRWGEQRFYDSKGTSRGKFTSGLRNLMERVEMDAYYCKDYPAPLLQTSDTSGATLRPLCVVRAVCALSGYVVGVGFCYEKEDLNGYLAALFCMAIGKDAFLELFGLHDPTHSWVSSGLSSDIVLDRGPASVTSFFKNQEHLASRELATSGRGQGKATVESAHPRQTKKSGTPEFRISNYNVVEMAKREIVKAMKRNNTANVRSRMAYKLDWADVDPTPTGIWNAFNTNLRTNAMPLNFDDAVRRYLPRISLTVHKGWCNFLGRLYDSADLRSTGIYESINKGRTTKCVGYALQMCVRYIWIEYKGKIYQISAQLPHIDNDEQLYISLENLADENRQRAAKDSKMRNKNLATSMIYHESLVKDVGKPPKTVSRQASLKRGSPATKRASKDHQSVFKNRNSDHD
ncbi:hypothetical protein [Pseudomonas putida]